MKPMVAVLGLVGVVGLAVAPGEAVAQIAKNVAAKSPWGPADEIGALNMMTDASRFDVLKQVAGGKIYDLGVDLFVGMPNCCGPFGDPTFQIWMTHTPARDTAKELLSYSGDGVDWLYDTARGPASEYWDYQLVQNYIDPRATFGEEPWASKLTAAPRELIPMFRREDIHVVVVGGETNGYWRIMGASYRKTVSIEEWR